MKNIKRVLDQGYWELIIAPYNHGYRAKLVHTIGFTFMQAVYGKPARSITGALESLEREAEKV